MAADPLKARQPEPAKVWGSQSVVIEPKTKSPILSDGRQVDEEGGLLGLIGVAAQSVQHFLTYKWRDSIMIKRLKDRSAAAKAKRNTVSLPRVRLSDPATNDSGVIRFGSGCAPAALRKPK